jgi:hypothetical protein
MKKTLVVVSSNREWERQTKDSVRAMQDAGAKLLHETGSASVTFARNRALSLTCEHLRGVLSDRDVVLMVDDDMEISLDRAQRVVDVTRRSGVAASAAYATAVSTLAGCRWQAKPGRWLAGCGCLAIPVALLLELERESEAFVVAGRTYRQFTWDQALDGEWIGEDFRLCMRLGGVQMLAIGVGHVKKWPLWPDSETLQRIADLALADKTK